MDNHDTNITACGFIVRDGKIFIAKRAATKKTFPDQFELVGGHLDAGETLEQGLEREIMEEIGLKVTTGEIIDAFTYDSEDMFKIEVCYLCYPDDPNAEPVLNPADHSTALWISEEEIDKFEKQDRETVALKKAFKRLKELK